MHNGNGCALEIPARSKRWPIYCLTVHDFKNYINTNDSMEYLIVLESFYTIFEFPKRHFSFLFHHYAVGIKVHRWRHKTTKPRGAALPRFLETFPSLQILSKLSQGIPTETPPVRKKYQLPPHFWVFFYSECFKKRNDTGFVFTQTEIWFLLGKKNAESMSKSFLPTECF